MYLSYLILLSFRVERDPRIYLFVLFLVTHFEFLLLLITHLGLKETCRSLTSHVFGLKQIHCFITPFTHLVQIGTVLKAQYVAILTSYWKLVTLRHSMGDVLWPFSTQFTLCWI